MTCNQADEWYHSFSLDGSEVLFVSNRDANAEIYIMDIDEGNQTDLTNNPSADYSRQFQPQAE